MHHTLEKIHSSIDDAMSMRSQSDWTPVANEDSVSLRSKKFPGFPLSHYQVETTLPFSNPHNVAKLSWDVDTLADAKKYDDKISSLTLLEEGTFGTYPFKVRRQTNDLPFPLYSRELVFVSYLVQNYEKYPDHVFVVGYSTDHALAPLDEKNFVRSNLEMSVFGINPGSNGGMLANRILNLNPNGNIPEFVINSQSTKLMNTFKDWRKMND